MLKLAKFGAVKTPAGALRHDANVVSITGIEGDYDAGLVPVSEAVERLERHKLRAIIYSSWSHTPDKPRWRVLVPLSAPIQPHERLRYAEALNGLLGGILAPESGNLSLSYYVGYPAGSERQTLVTFDDPDEGLCLDEIDDLDIHRASFRPKGTGTGKATGSNGGGYLQGLLSGDDVHENALRLVARLVNKGLSDDEIKAIFAGLAVHVERARDAERAACLVGSELDRLIQGARAKGYDQARPKVGAEATADAEGTNAALVERPSFAVHDDFSDFGKPGLYWHGIKGDEIEDVWADDRHRRCAVSVRARGA